MKRILIVAAGMLFLTGLNSCNKVKSTSKRLMKTGDWKVTELSVNGVNEEELPKWEIDDCDIYDESCFGEWKNDEGGHAEFIWQFREKGEVFELSYQAEEHDHEEEGEHEHDHAAEEAAEQAANFSGVYEVEKKEKKVMEFTSSSTVGYSGSRVKIKVEKI